MAEPKQKLYAYVDESAMRPEIQHATPLQGITGDEPRF